MWPTRVKRSAYLIGSGVVLFALSNFLTWTLTSVVQACYVLDAEEKIQLGNDTYVQFDENGSLVFRRFGDGTQLRIDQTEVKTLLRNDEKCFTSVWRKEGRVMFTLSENGTIVMCQTGSDRRIIFVQANTSVALDHHQYINLIIAMSHAYVFQTDIDADASFLPVGQSVFVSICRRNENEHTILIDVREFINDKPSTHGIQLNREQITKLYATSCPVDEPPVELGDNIRLDCTRRSLGSELTHDAVDIRQYNRTDQPTLRGIRLNYWQFRNLYRLREHILRRLSVDERAYVCKDLLRRSKITV